MKKFRKKISDVIKFMRIWKRADIILMHKNGNKEEPLNCISVSLISIVCNVCEKIINIQYVEYLEGNTILTDRQFRFQEGRSCDQK